MRCEDALLHVHDREDGVLDSALGPELDAHLAVCSECAAAAAGLRRLRSAFRAFPPVVAPAELPAAVARDIGRARVPGRVLAWPRIALPVAAAAALFVGAVVISQVRRPIDIAAEPKNGFVQGEGARASARTGTAFTADGALVALESAESEDGKKSPEGGSSRPQTPAGPVPVVPPPAPATDAGPGLADSPEPTDAPVAGSGPSKPEARDGTFGRRGRGADARRAAGAGLSKADADAPSASDLAVEVRVAAFRTEADARAFLAALAVTDKLADRERAFDGPTSGEDASGPATGRGGADADGGDVQRESGGGGGGAGVGTGGSHGGGVGVGGGGGPPPMPPKPAAPGESAGDTGGAGPAGAAAGASPGAGRSSGPAPKPGAGGSPPERAAPPGASAAQPAGTAIGPAKQSAGGAIVGEVPTDVPAWADLVRASGGYAVEFGAAGAVRQSGRGDDDGLDAATLRQVRALVEGHVSRSDAGVGETADGSAGGTAGGTAGGSADGQADGDRDGNTARDAADAPNKDRKAPDPGAPPTDADTTRGPDRRGDRRADDADAGRDPRDDRGDGAARPAQPAASRPAPRPSAEPATGATFRARRGTVVLVVVIPAPAPPKPAQAR